MAKSKKSQVVLVEDIEPRILIIRGRKVILDADLAQLYGTTTKALNQAVKRNADRFPGDFRSQLSAREKQQVVTNCDHLQRLEFSRASPTPSRSTAPSWRPVCSTRSVRCCPRSAS